jgi:hypothetical protein
MSEDDLIAIGLWCEDLLQQEFFRTVVDTFDKACYEQIMSSEPHEKMKRDSTYNEYRGAKAFLDHIRALVDQKNQIEQRNALSQAADAHIPGID